MIGVEVTPARGRMVLNILASALLLAGAQMGAAQAQGEGVSIGTVAWSPDGKSLAFDSNKDGDDEIYFINVDGTGLKQLTHNESMDHSPSFTNDGKSVVYIDASGAPRNTSINLVGLEGGKPRLLFGFEGAIEYGARQIAGGRYTFHSLRPPAFRKTDIYAWDSETGEIELLVSSPRTDHWGSWSRVGGKFVFTSNRDWPDRSSSPGPRRTSEIYVADWDGSNQRRLTFSPDRGESEFQGCTQPTIAPDGRRVVYLTDRDGEKAGELDLYLHDLETGKME